MIISNKAQCKSCGDIIESFYTHDFKWCSCKSIAVDGGKSYLRRIGDPAILIELSEMKKEEDFILKDLITRANIDDVCGELRKNYYEFKDVDHLMEDFKEFFYKLLFITPVPTDMMIKVESVTDDDGEEYYNVSGYDGKQYWGLAFTPWSEWLGMKVEYDKSLSINQAVAHILWEMTFYGFEEEEVDFLKEEIQQRMEDVRSGKVQYLTLDEVFEKLTEEK